jgi:hypothetical protein
MMGWDESLRRWSFTGLKILDARACRDVYVDIAQTPADHRKNLILAILTSATNW